MPLSPVGLANSLARKFGIFERFSRDLSFERLQEFLPYKAWDPDTGIYILDYGPESRLGWFFVSDRTITPREAFIREFESLVSVLPPKSTLQIALATMPYVDRIAAEFLILRNKTRLRKRKNPYPLEKRLLLARMLTQKIALLREQCLATKIDRSHPILVKQLKLYFSFTVAPKGLSPEEIFRAKSKTKTILDSMGFSPREGTPDDLVDLLGFLFLNGKTVIAPSRNFPVYSYLVNNSTDEKSSKKESKGAKKESESNKESESDTKDQKETKNQKSRSSKTSGKEGNERKFTVELREGFLPLSYFLVPFSIGLAFETDHMFTTEGRFIASISYRHYPDKVSVGAFDALLGDPWRGTMQLPYSFCHILNVYVPEQSSIKGKLTRKHAVAAWQSFGPMAKFVPKMSKLKEDCEELLFRAEKEHILEAYLHTLVIADDQERLEEAVSGFITHAKRHGFFPVRDKFVIGPLLFNSLPMGLFPDEAPRLFRQRTLSSAMCACLAPVHGEGKRFGQPILLFTTRRGGIFAGDIFASPQGYNGLVFGGTGGGKSFLLNEIATLYFSVGGKIIILDVGRSFRKICDLWGGEYIEFSPDSNININPFSHLSTDPKELEEDMEMLKDFLEMMAAPREGLNDYQRGALTEIFKDVITQYGKETTFDLIAERLSKYPDQRVKDIAVMLKPWCKGGENYRWVSGGRPIDFESDFIVIEMEELMSRPALQKAAIFYFLYRIGFDFLQKTLRNPEFREKPKLLLIDEAWEALKSGSADFIERAYRRFRKTGSGCWIITQGPMDLEGSPIANALWNNAHFVVSLKLESINREELKKRLTEFAIEAIATLNTAPGKYSEFYFKTPFGEDIVRFYAPRFTQLAYTTEPREVARIEAYRKQGLSYADAIQAVLREDAREVAKDSPQKK